MSYLPTEPSRYQKRKLAALKKKAASQSTRTKGVSNAYGQPRPRVKSSHKHNDFATVLHAWLLVVLALIITFSMVIVSYHKPGSPEAIFMSIYALIANALILFVWILFIKRDTK